MQLSRSWLSDIASAAVSVALLIVGVILLLLASPSRSVVATILVAGSAIALVSVGLTLVLRAGRLDLSVPGVAALAAVLAARIDVGGHSLALGLLVAVAVGAGGGLINGLLGTPSRMGAAAVTLGTAAVAGMIALQASGGNVLGFKGTDSAAVTAAALVLAVLVGAGVTVLLLPMIASAPLDGLAGEDERPHLVSGVLVLVFVCSGVLAALAGVFEAASIGLAVPEASTDLLLEGLAAALIGGSALRGRSGTGYGAVLASFAIAALLTALALHGVSGEVHLGIVGGLVVVGVLFSEARSRVLP